MACAKRRERVCRGRLLAMVTRHKARMHEKVEPERHGCLSRAQVDAMHGQCCCGLTAATQAPWHARLSNMWCAVHDSCQWVDKQHHWQAHMTSHATSCPPINFACRLPMPGHAADQQPAACSNFACHSNWISRSTQSKGLRFALHPSRHCASNFGLTHACPCPRTCPLMHEAHSHEQTQAVSASHAAPDARHGPA